jgi:molybdopterin-containing oxidoreductase family membrane subunit
MASITPDNLADVRDNTFDDPTRRAPLVLGDKSFGDVTASVADIALKPVAQTKLPWVIGFIISLSLLGMLGSLLAYLLLTGVGVWGNNNTVAWGFPIVNFVFWVGIGHAGTLISAILFLFRQDWRTGINRFAEAMTIFAVTCAGLFPGIHVGRAWLAYWLFPYPNQMAMWPNFRSPLLWDVFAVSTYATVSMLFWYMGMIPDIATLRDRAKDKPRQIIYGILALGWRGSNRHWHRYEKAYLLLAALATPLVLSVHSVVSFDFAVSQVPGWHTTIFPPYFVAGAIFGGFAMVLCLLIPARQWYGLQDIITRRHVDNCAKVLLGTGMIVGYAYVTEIFVGWYSTVDFEKDMFLNRMSLDSPISWAFWLMMFCNVVAPQVLWSKKMRNNMLIVWTVALLANVGMWFERFVIIITSLERPHLPSSWAAFIPTWVDYGMLIGSFGLFFTFFLLFCRFLPMVAIAEVKAIMPAAHEGHHGTARGGEAGPKTGDANTDYRA